MSENANCTFWKFGYWMVLDGIGWSCMVLDGLGWYWKKREMMIGHLVNQKKKLGKLETITCGLGK